jgi:hypothetical protein
MIWWKQMWEDSEGRPHSHEGYADIGEPFGGVPLPAFNYHFECSEDVPLGVAIREHMRRFFA